MLQLWNWYINLINDENLTREELQFCLFGGLLVANITESDDNTMTQSFAATK